MWPAPAKECRNSVLKVFHDQFLWVSSDKDSQKRWQKCFLKEVQEKYSPGVLMANFEEFKRNFQIFFGLELGFEHFCLGLFWQRLGLEV